MKRFKKILAMVIAMAMVLSMGAMTAFAADDYTLTINNTVSGHTYTAYQIFKGSKADTSQVTYTAVASNASYDANTTYYYKNGADYDVLNITSAEEFGAAKAEQTLYTRTGDSALGDVIWGANITTAGKAALYEAYDMGVDEEDYDDQANIKALLDAIADVDTTSTSESDKAVKFANVFFTTDNDGNVTAVSGLLTGGTYQESSGGTITFNNLASGYYIVNDSYEADGDEVNGIDYSIARIAVQVVGNTIINNKADKPTVEKEIVTSGDLDNEKANELGIGRAVNFKVTDTVPNYDGYNYYYFVMRDKLSEGLTFNPGSVVITIDGTALTEDTDYYVYAEKTDAAGNDGADADVIGNDTFVIAFENIMNYAVGKEIVVTYSATVNDDALVGVEANTNEVRIDYSNNPTKSERGDIDEDHPGVPENNENHPVGTTPKDYTDTYTTQLTIIKIDGDTEEKLNGVEFTLTGTSQDVIVKNEEVFEVDPDGTYWLLNDGTYTTTAPTAATLTETTNNSGWVAMTATEAAAYTGNDVRVIGETQYRPFDIDTDTAKTRYVITESNEGDYASTTVKYSLHATITQDTVDEYVVSRSGVTGGTDANDKPKGELVFSQLGAGSYTLSETGVLAGYNDIEDISFDIVATLPEEGTADSGKFTGDEVASWRVTNISPETATIEYNETTGVFTINIENNKGVQLPSTGGIGTTIFYVVGAILVIGAGVIMITRRRMDA